MNIDTEQAARILGVSRMTVRNECKAGRLTHCRPSQRKIVLRLHDVLAYKAAHTFGPMATCNVPAAS